MNYQEMQPDGETLIQKWLDHTGALLTMPPPLKNAENFYQEVCACELIGRAVVNLSQAFSYQIHQVAIRQGKIKREMRRWTALAKHGE